jgi:hypothetical protein
MCPFCNERMKGRKLCEGHERELAKRAASFNLTRGDALDQLWSVYQDDFADAQAEREGQLWSEEHDGNGYPAGTIGAETR